MVTSGTSKSALREAVIAARRRLAPADRAERSARIAERVLALEPFQRARLVGLYSAMGAEVATAAIAAACLAQGKLTAYPRSTGSERALAFAVCPPSDLVPGALGAREPPALAPFADRASLDLVLVPGVAFDLRCRRLGRGRGHYDATLATLAGRAMLVGLAFELQIVDEVPFEPHDAPVDAVVTEARVVFRLPPDRFTGRS